LVTANACWGVFDDVPVLFAGSDHTDRVVIETEVVWAVTDHGSTIIKSERPLSGRSDGPLPVAAS